MENEEIKQIKKLLEENIKLNKELLEKTEKIEKYVKLRKVWGVLKVVFIAIPLILSFIYLPPLLKPIVDEYLKIFQNIKNPSAVYEQDVSDLDGGK